MRGLRIRAERPLREPEKALSFVKKVQTKYTAKSIPNFTDFRRDMELALALMKDVLTRRYTKVPWSSVVMIAASFLYFLNPFDIVPDFIPVKGLLDDGTVLVYVPKTISADLVQIRRVETQYSG